MDFPRRSLERGEVADVRDDGSGLVGAVGTVAALLATLDEGDLAVGFAEVRDHKPAAGGDLAGRLDGMPHGLVTGGQRNSSDRAAGHCAVDSRWALRHWQWNLGAPAVPCGKDQ